MNAAASNLANAGSVTGTEAEAYRPIRPVFAEHYDAAGRRPEPTITRMPSAESLKGRSILIVDEVWESGRTLALVAERARAAVATVRTAVVHHKPGKSEVPGAPDFFAALADGWITYPYKGGE